MARPLRVQRVNDRYHLNGRGNDRDRLHFLELLGQMVERYGAQVHAYALMDNHFHLLIQTPEANLSRALHWLNVSYSVWLTGTQAGTFDSAELGQLCGGTNYATVAQAVTRFGKRLRYSTRASAKTICLGKGIVECIDPTQDPTPWILDK